MRKSKLFILFALVIIIVLALSSALIACDRNGENGGSDTDSGDVKPPRPPIIDDDDDDDEEEETIYYDPEDAINKIVGGITAPEQVLSLDVNTTIKTDNGLMTVSLKGNFYSDVKNEIVFSVYHQLSADSEKNLKFGIYIIDGKIYLDFGKDELGNDTALLYLEDFDMNYILKILENSPEKLGDLKVIIEDFLEEKGFPLKLDSLVEIIIPFMFADPVITVSENNTVSNINMELKLRYFIEKISGILSSIGVKLPFDINSLLQDLLEIIPEISMYVVADFNDDGTLTNLGLDIKDIDATSPSYQDEVCNIDATIGIYDQAIAIDVPEISDRDISNFSFTNIQFSLDFNLATDADPLDVGKLINGFMGTNTLPVGILMLEGGTGLRLQFKMDLDLNYDNAPEDNNMLAIEVFLIDQTTGQVIQPAQIGIYYIDGSFYLKLDNMLPDYMKDINVKINAPLDDLISGLVTMITDAIDGVFNIDFDELKNSTVEDNGKIATTSGEDIMALLASTTSPVLALTQDTDDGKVYVSPTIQALIAAVSNMLGLSNNFIADNDSIDVILNNDFLNAIGGLTGSALPFAFPESVGDIVLSINFAEIGLESVKVDTSIDNTLNAQIKLHDFLIGMEQEDLDLYITDQINKENTTYLTSLNGVIDKVLGGVTMSSNINLKFNAGTYDLAPFIAGFGISELERTEILWTFNDNFVLDAQLTVQVALDRNTPANSQFVFEIKTNQGVNIGSTQIFDKNTVLLGIYGYNNRVYIDISNFKIANITLPKLSFDMNFSQIVYTLIDDQIGQLLEKMQIEGDDLPFDFDLAGLLGIGKASTAATEEKSSVSMATENTQEGTPEEELAAIIFGLNTDQIYATVSLAAIMAILAQTQTEVGQTLAEALSLMEVDLTMKMGRKDGFTFDFTGEMIPMLDAEGNAVYYYGADGTRLPSRDEEGNKLYYTSDQYARKEYNYGSDLSLSFTAGTEANPIIVGDISDAKYDMEQVIGDFEQYQSDLVQAVVDTVGSATVKATIDLTTYDNSMNITQIINTILASVGQRLDLPINLNLDDWQSQVELLIQWDLDFKNTANSAMLLTMEYEGKQIFGLYIYRNSLMIDLEGLGLFKLEIVNSSIITRLFEAIDNLVTQIGDFDLNTIIGDLLEQNGLPTVSGSATPSEDEDVATDGNAPTVGEDLEVMDYVKYILQAVSLEDTKIVANFSASLVNTLLTELLGMSLGIDIELGADLDLFGNQFNFNVGVEDIEALINMQLQVGGDIDIQIDYDSIPNWDATNGETFARTMLDNLDIGFVLDLANYTADTDQQLADEDTDQGVVYTRVVIEKLKQPKTLENTASTITVPTGNFLITLAHIDGVRYDNSNAGTFTPLVYIILDYTKASGQLRIVLCKNVINFVVDVGDYVDISIDLDLIATLAPVFENLFTQIDGALSGIGGASSASTEEVALANEDATTEATGFAKIFAELDIVALLNGGIDLNLRNNGNFNVDITFNTYLINKLIDDVLSMVFGPETILDLSVLAPDIFSTNYLANVKWTREIVGVDGDGNSFWGSLRNQIAPILSDVVKNLAGISLSSGLIDAFAGSVYYQVRQILAGILPFAVFNEMRAGIEVADATIANIYIEGYDYAQDIYDLEGNVAYAASQPARRDGYYTKIKLYNTSASVGNIVEGDDGQIIYPEGVVTWGDIPTEILFDPYAYSSIDAGEQRLILDYFTGKEATYQRAQNLFKTDVQFEIVSERGTATSKDISLLDLSLPGEYTIRASATFANGVTRTLDIKILSRSKGVGIQSIDDISMHVYDAMPDFITINVDLGDGQIESRKLNVEYITFENIAPQSFKAHEVVGNVKFADNSTKEIKINYLDSTVVEINAGGAQGKVITIDLYEFSLTSDITDYISDVLFFKYADGMSTGLDITSEWNVDGASVLFDRTTEDDGLSRDVSGCQFVVTTQIGQGATLQDVQLIFIVHTKQVSKLTINGLENTLRIDPYRYYLYLTTGDEQYNPFPSTATASYYQAYESIGEEAKVDAYDEEVAIKWGNFENVDFGWDNDNATATPIKAMLDNSQYPNSSFTWDFDTRIVMLRNEIEAFYFDEELTQTTYYIDPFEYFINEKNGVSNYPDKAYVKFTNGSVYYLPIAWSIPDSFEVGFENQFTQAVVTIGFDPVEYANSGKLVEVKGLNGIMIQQSYTNIIVRDLDPQGIVLAGSELSGGTYYIDPVQVNYYGMPAFPEKVTVQYKSKDSMTTDLPVDWVDDNGNPVDENYQIPMYGAENLVFYACITDEIKYKVNVSIIDRMALNADIKDITINPYNYSEDEYGNRVYQEYAKTTVLSQKVGTLDLETYLPVGVITATSPKAEDKTTYLSYVITYSDAEGKEAKFESDNLADVQEFVEANKASIKTAEVYENFVVDIVWDLTEINYSVPDVYQVKALIAKGTDFEKAIAVNVTILDMPIKSVGGANYYYSITEGGVSLTTEQAITKTIVRDMPVYFADENNTSGQYECTIDLRDISFDYYTLEIRNVRGENKYYNNKGQEITSEQILENGIKVPVTVCSGDIAQTTTITVHIVKYTTVA